MTNTRVHSGYRRVHVLLRRGGHTANVKRIYRLRGEQCNSPTKSVLA